MTASNQRKANQLRPVTIEPFPTNAAAAYVITQGNTRVLCTASISEEPPKWLPRDEEGNFCRGWVTAEYNMLPGSTGERKRRGPDSRGTEIQRLIGRVLRAAVNLEKMPGVAITCDCDVLVADGGTRTASITGAYVALASALIAARTVGVITDNPIISPVAAVSVGIVNGKPVLDLDYPLDSTADVDMNIAMNTHDEFVEIQGTGEGTTFTQDQLNQLLDLAAKGIKQLHKLQKQVLKA